MEAFSPVGAHLTPEYHSKYDDASNSVTVALPKSSVFRPSTLRNAVTAQTPQESATGKKPLLERLQSAIKSIESRSSVPTTPTLLDRSMKASNQNMPSEEYVSTGNSGADAANNSPQDNPSLRMYEEYGRYETAAAPYAFPHAAATTSDPKPQPSNALKDIPMTAIEPTGPKPAEPAWELRQLERLIEQSHRRLHSQLQTEVHALHMDMLKQGVAMQSQQEALLRMYLPQVKELVEEVRGLREENERLRARLKYQ